MDAKIEAAIVRVQRALVVARTRGEQVIAAAKALRLTEDIAHVAESELREAKSELQRLIEYADVTPEVPPPAVAEPPPKSVTVVAAEKPPPVTPGKHKK